MSNILARVNRDLLEQFAWSNVLLAFDFDGTLAPIVSDPARAAMRRRTRDLLCEASRLYPVAILSGRAQPDVLDRMRGVPVGAVVGNHGAEPSRSSSRLALTVRQWLPALRSQLGELKGVIIEDKRFSLAIHYRHSRGKKAVRAEIAAALAALDGVRVIPGKEVVNLLPVGAPHKGVALERERARFSCDTAIYVGDDDTDEDVFALDQPGRLLSIRVGFKRDSAARYHVESQRGIDDLLRALLVLRRRSEPRRVASR